MEPMPAEPRGPALFGPPAEPSGLPVLPGLAERLAASAGRGAPEPVGGGPELLDAACGYWARRGLATGPERLLAAAGPQPLLLALLAAAGGDVFTTRPCAPWHSAQPLVLGRPAYPVPVPAECGVCPIRSPCWRPCAGCGPRAGPPRARPVAGRRSDGHHRAPELLHEVCEAAAGEGLLIISDETDRDALHPSPVSVPDTPDTLDTPDTPGTPDAAAPPGGPARDGRGRPVFVSPAEMLPEHVVVLAGLGTTLLPPGWPAAIARFPAGREGAGLRAAALGVLAGTPTGPGAPLAAAVAHALTEPPDVTERLRAAARLHGILAAALYRTVVRHGALGRPPRAGTGSTPTSARSVTRWPPGGSVTPWSWRSTSPGGSASPWRAGTGSAIPPTRSASGSPPSRCSRRTGPAASGRSPPRTRWTRRTRPGR